MSGAPSSLPLEGFAVLNDTPVACQTRRPTDPQGDRCPHIPAALAATYPLRCFAPQWARFDNRQRLQRTRSYPRTASAAAAQEVQAIPEPTTSPAAPIPRDQHRQICTCPPRAKGPLDRRSKRLSFPHFFLRRKKCGRRRPPPRQGKIDSPPGRRNPPRAKGSLNRRFEWFSLVTFFLQKKKVTRAGARNSPSCARRRNTSLRPQAQHPLAAGAAKHPSRARRHKKTASRRPFSCFKPCPRRRARRRQLKRHGLSRLRVPERHARRPQRDGCVCVRRVPVPPVAHQRHPS